MKVIGYVRVSTDEQASQGVSLAAQADKIRAYCALYDLELIDIIEDAGQSAKSLNRPGIQRALGMLRNGEAGGLIVAKLDRLTRSVRDVADLCDTVFSRTATLFSVGDQLDTRSAAGRLVVNILACVSQWEREAIGERTKTALAYKKSQGVRLGAPPTARQTDDSDTVARILELRAQDCTLWDIVHTLQAEGRPTKRGGQWAPKTVAQVLARHGVAA
ncbi:MAG TPA: recombinase family protein [Candidatus Xenobia bacterium]|jgi:DNA invertase Pin-like site-specific DNA recombinase